MRIKTTSSETILALIQQHHVDNPTDTDLVICELSDSAALALAKNFPEWVMSFSFAPDIASHIVEIFRENLSASNQLKKQTDSKETKRIIIREEESDLKRVRKPSKKSSTGLGITLYTDTLALIASLSDNFKLLISLSQLNKRCYQKAYLRSFEFTGKKSFTKQRQNLCLFIKNAFIYFNISGIETTLRDYKNREDIPATNRILVIACLVILAILKNDNENFQRKLTELFVFSAINPILEILCWYIQLYKGEYIQCRELVRTRIEEALYDRTYDYLDPQQNFGAMLQSRALDLKNQLVVMLNHLRSAYEHMEFFDIASKLVIFEKLRRFPLLELELTKACINYIRLLHQKNGDGRNNKLLLFPLLRFITHSTPAVDFAELCFSLNYFSLNVQDNHFMDDNNIIAVVELFSSKNKQKVLDMLLNALEKMLHDPDFIIFQAKDVFYKKTIIDARIKVYLDLIQTLSPRTLATFVKKYLDAYIDAAVPADKLKGVKFVIYCASDKIDAQVEKLWLIYKKITTVSSLKDSTKNMQFAIANIIGRNFEDYRHLPEIDWVAIKTSMFYGVITYVTTSNPDAGSFFSPRERDSIVVLSKLCKDSPVMVEDKTKLALFNCLFSSSYSQDDAELWIMIMHCCFKTREDFSKFLNEQGWSDRQSEDSQLALLQGPTVAEKYRTVRAVVALAPRLEVPLVEVLFDEIDQRIKDTIDIPGDDTEWFDFLEALTNLVFYISPEKRAAFFASLSKKQHDAMFDPEYENFALTIQTCRLLCEREELLKVERVNLNCILSFCRNPGLDNFTGLKLDAIKKLLLVLYTKNNECDDEVLFRYYLEENRYRSTRQYYIATFSKCRTA